MYNSREVFACCIATNKYTDRPLPHFYRLQQFYCFYTHLLRIPFYHFLSIKTCSYLFVHVDKSDLYENEWSTSNSRPPCTVFCRVVNLPRTQSLYPRCIENIISLILPRTPGLGAVYLVTRLAPFLG